MGRGSILLALLAVAACSTFDASGQPSDGGADADVDASAADATAAADGGSTDSAGPCPSGRGPAMVLVDLGATRFCIDATEVTRAQYRAFLDGQTALADQPSLCAKNLSFSPVPTIDFDAGAFPMAGIDWCDALAYCTWAGKRLCGSIADGGPLRAAAASDPTRSEWMAACTRNGSRPQPYGQTASAGACNLGTGTAAAVGTYPGCVGGYDGIFDMVGNVTEWENACDEDAGDGGGPKCVDRGGSYKATGGACSFASYDGRMAFSSDWGIRCCAASR